MAVGSNHGSKKGENVNKHLALYTVAFVTLTVLLVRSVSVNAADDPRKDTATDLELICLTEQPAIVEGESATLKAWVSTLDGRSVTTPIKFEWEVNAGRIRSQAAATQWDLSTEKVEEVRDVTATVKVRQFSGSELRCEVKVFIGKKEATIRDRGTLRDDNLLSARRFLLPNDIEEPGYGLYSYLLFSAPPKDTEERARYLKTIEAYLRVLQDDVRLRRHVLRIKLNATYLPIEKLPAPGKSDAERAVNILAVYDYANAQRLLRKVEQAHQQGPYLLSVRKPMSEAVESTYLWVDLTGVVPELASQWMQDFVHLAAQQRSWSEVSLNRLRRNIRNLIGVGGKATLDVMKGLEKLIQFQAKG